MANNANDVLSIARGEIGYCRWDDNQAGTKYGRWYAQLKNASYYGTSGVPFCAMFVSWVFDQAGASCAGIPEAYCPYIKNAAKSAGKVINSRDAQPGDVVLFQWDSGAVDHVGIVEKNYGSYIQTIEGNTTINGRSGSVGRRTRAWSVVDTVIRPNWGATGAQGGTSGSTSGSTSDGLGDTRYWGPKFTREMQKQLGTTQDGVVSAQPTSNKRYLPNADTSSWRFTSNYKGGSDMVKALQRKVGADADGWCGKKTVTALQKWLQGKGYSVGASGCDGSLGPATCQAVGKALQDSAFK